MSLGEGNCPIEHQVTYLKHFTLHQVFDIRVYDHRGLFS